MIDLNIPKLLHYVWIGGEENQPDIVNYCINSWAEFAPEFELVRWDESNMPVDEISETLYNMGPKRYSQLSDYIRFVALVEHGGVYLDADVELIKPISLALENGSFISYSQRKYAKYMINPAVCACFPEHGYWKLMLANTKILFHSLEDPAAPFFNNFGPWVATHSAIEYMSEDIIHYRPGKYGDVSLLPWRTFHPYPVDYADIQKFWIKMEMPEETIGIHRYMLSHIVKEYH